MARVRRFCFTSYDMDRDWTILSETVNYSYILMGHEICPTTGRDHLQGYIEFPTKKTLSSVIKLLKPSHVKICKGDQESNIVYCSKEENIYFEDGEKMKQGKRSDLDTVRELIQDGAGMEDVVDVATSYQSVRMAECILKYKEKKRNWDMEVIWMWGPTGSGKTKGAYMIFGDERVWESGKNLKWWEGYDAHPNVLIDDFRKDYCTFHELLRILDRYPYRVECKGGTRQLLAKRVIITAPYPPEQVYETREDIGQLLRRITKIVYIGPEIEKTAISKRQEVGGNTRPRRHPRTQD